MRQRNLLLFILSIMIGIGNMEGKVNNGAITKEKALIVFFSRRGPNYVNGDIVDLKYGNTEIMAGKIQKLLNIPAFRLDPVVPYPSDYNKCTEVAQEELKKGASPKYKGDVPNFAQYDTIYLGYPNWWGTFPMIVKTFLESHDFNDKTIIPFCTHEGSAMGRSEMDLKKYCPNTIVLKGLPIKGSNVKNADNDIESWLKSLGKYK